MDTSVQHGHGHHHHGEGVHCHCHEHGHHHHEEEGGLRRQIVTIVAASVLLGVAIVLEHSVQLPTWQLLLVYLVPYLVAGHETLHEAVEGLARGDVFNEHFLMTIATVGALAIGFLPGAETQFPEAVFVMLFFQVGELCETYAEGKSREGIARLMDIRPDTANVEADGVIAAVHAADVAVGQTIVVRPGERVPLDGVITGGSTTLDTSALTGESMPREAGEGQEVASGCVNVSGVIRVRTTRSFGQSTASRIIELVENAGERKSASEAFITRFARIYTPIVVAAAVLLAVVPTLAGGELATWLYRALLFLVVSCPCALVLSVPLTFFGGIGGAARRGILVKGANYLDALAKVNTVVFDKTGTLTEGQFAVTALHPQLIDEQELLHLAAHVEHFSTHPIGAALRDAFPDEATDGCAVSQVEEVAGQGVKACVDGRTVCVGNTRMMDAVGAEWHDCHHVGTIIHVAIDGVYAGHIVISDKVKADSAGAIARLTAMGVGRTVMLTGDRRDVAEDVARRLNVTEWHAELMPADKVVKMKEERDRGKVAFVGDGINDAPVLALADVGMAMGALGSDAAIEAADVVLMDDRPSKVPTAIALARRTLAIARQNVALALGIKVAVLVLAALGVATMWMAVFADVGVTVMCVLNAMRTLSGAAGRDTSVAA